MAKGPFDTKPEEFQLVKAVLGEKTTKKSKVSMSMVEPAGTSESTSLAKSIKDLLDGPKGSVERLAFEISPRKNSAYGSLYMVKERLLPDELIKRISIQDDLVAAIANARAFHIASNGRPQPDRFSTGFKIEPEPGLLDKLDEEGKKKLQEQIANAEMRILTCGKTAGYTDEDVVLFSQFLWQTTRQAVLHGRIAVEAIKNKDGKFHSFRAIDVGTIYKAAPWSDDSQAEALRRSAINRIAKLKNTRLDPARFEKGDYKWVQVIENIPEQAFTADECIVHNFYPVLDVELGGYPISPLDTVISAVTTHINITNHNKLYFENGRASRGMIVVQSDDADESTVQHIRQAFQASINNTKNAWRMPVFAVGQDSNVAWYPIDNSGRDMEFQYLSDTNARVILSAFQMSPEELPGYAHLARGANSQALSEGNNEFKLTAARDVGLRPLLAAFQDFMNYRMLPLIDEDLSTKASFKFVGLDAETAEKESIRLQQDMAVHMSINEVLNKVEKKPLPKQFGGEFLLNPQWQAVLDKYVPVGAIMEYFFGMEGASKDPRFAFLNNPLYFQQINLLNQQQQMQMAQQQMAQQSQQQSGNSGEPASQNNGQEEEDLSRSADQLSGLLNKSEIQLSSGKKKLLAQQRKLVSNAIRALEDESREVVKEILEVVEKAKKK